MSDYGDITILVETSDSGQRLDVVAGARIPDCSRSYAATLVTEAKIVVNGQPRKPGYRVKPGDTIRAQIPKPQPIESSAEPIPLQILYEDTDIVVINKQSGLVVHPAPGHTTGTLVNAVLYHCPRLGAIGGEIRPGIVHRLDKDTSGTIVVAKNAAAHEKLSAQFKNRTVSKDYLALVYGEPQSDSGTINIPIGRHPVDRKRMSITTRKGRKAETLWKVRERFGGLTLFELRLKTGRTHQIRVHCAAIQHPLVGDQVYHPRKLSQTLKKEYASIAGLVKTVPRQMLHAWRLGLTHPGTDKFMSFESQVPPDMASLIDSLRNLRSKSF